MLKRNIVKLLSILTSLILCSLVIFKGISSSPDVYLFFYLGSLIFAITMFMIYKKPYIKNKKSIYETFLIVLLVSSLFIIGLMLYFYIDSSFANLITYDYTAMSMLSTVLYLSFILLNLILCVSELKVKSNKVSDILFFITTGIAILEFAVFALYGGDDTFRLMLEDGKSKSIYIIQNYIYFAIMYAFTFIHKTLNRVF